MAARAREPKDGEDAGTLDARAVVERMKSTVGIKTDLDLAGVCDVPFGTLNTWKKRNSIPLGVLIRFAKAWHVSLDWLILGTETEAAQTATAEALRRAGQEAGRASHGLDYQRDDRLSALFRARPDVMEMMTRLGHRTEADIRAMLNETKTMTLDVLEEMRDHFRLPLGVMIDGRAEIDIDALETALSMALDDPIRRSRPTSKGLIIDDEETVLSSRRVQENYYWTKVIHLAGVVAGNYCYITKRNLEEPGWAEKQ